MEVPGQALTVEIVPISKLSCSPVNPRKNEEAVPHVAASLRRFTRLKAAQKLGMTEVPVWWFTVAGIAAAATMVPIEPTAATMMQMRLNARRFSFRRPNLTA